MPNAGFHVSVHRVAQAIRDMRRARLILAGKGLGMALGERPGRSHKVRANLSHSNSHRVEALA